MNIDNKVCVNVPITKQIGIDSWRDSFVTKIFLITTSIIDILEWAKNIDRNIKLSDLYINEYYEEDLKSKIQGE